MQWVVCFVGYTLRTVHAYSPNVIGAAAVSIIFVVTKVLLRQTHVFSNEKSFVASNVLSCQMFCRVKSMLVATKLLYSYGSSRQWSQMHPCSAWPCDRCSPSSWLEQGRPEGVCQLVWLTRNHITILNHLHWFAQTFFFPLVLPNANSKAMWYHWHHVVIFATLTKAGEWL